MKDTLASKTVQMALVFAGIGIGCVLRGGQVAAAHVLRMGHGLKVIRVHASRIPAEVIPLKALWWLPDKEVMSEDVNPINPMVPVSPGRGEIAQPLEAAITATRVNAAPEALSDVREMKFNAAVLQPAVVVHPAHAEMCRGFRAIAHLARARVLRGWAEVYSLWHRRFLSVSTPRAVTAAPGHLSALYFSAFVRGAR